MIKQQHLLNDLDPKMKTALSTLDFALGRVYDVQITGSKMTEEEFNLVELQGGNLQTLNKARKAAGLYEKAANSNFKIVKKDWFEELKSGKGVLFQIQTGSFRHKFNPDIHQAIQFVEDRFPEIKLDHVENNSFVSFFYFIPSSKPKKKKEEPIEEPKHEEQQQIEAE